jgi:hypothetical protein
MQLMHQSRSVVWTQPVHKGPPWCVSASCRHRFHSIATAVNVHNVQCTAKRQVIHPHPRRSGPLSSFTESVQHWMGLRVDSWQAVPRAALMRLGSLPYLCV